MGDIQNISTLLSTLNISLELTTSMTTLNVSNMTSVAEAKREDLENLLPETLVKVRNICVYYVSFVLWLLSVPANILIVYILGQKKNSNFSTAIYFTSLAVADLVVNFRTLLFWLDTSRLVTYRSNFECMLAKGLHLVGMVASSWTLAFISIERMLSVCLLQKVKLFCNANIARVCVIAIWTLSLTIGSIQAWFNEFRDSRCLVKKKHFKFFVDNIIYVYFSFDIVIPFFVIMVCSITVVSRLAYIKASSSASSKAFGKSVTVLVLVVNVVFFVTQFPYGVMFVVQQIRAQYATKLQMEVLNYLEDILLVLKYVNNGINFYLYFMTASKFRNEARQLLLPFHKCCGSICRRNNNKGSSFGSNSTQRERI